jgi:nanoRNase/pAp phosphatase (c-di-AMP/oligoRNAs hydrolase)
MQIITTHKNTDFDGLASVIAGTLLYPDAVGVIPKMVNPNVAQFLSTHKTAFNIVLPHEVRHALVDTLVIVDTDRWQRLDRMEKLKDRKDIAIHIWDHHLNGCDIEADWTCQEHIGATVTLFVREFRKRGILLSPLVSTVMLIGLYEDTGHLTYPSTRAEDANAAAYLLENGADLHVAGRFLNPPYEETQKEILFELMKVTDKRKINDHSVAVNIVRLDSKVTMLAGIVNMYRKIINADAVFVIFVSKSESRSTVIARSGIDRIDVGAMMQAYGGGGHSGAGSATVKFKDYTPEALKKSIIQHIEKDQKEVAKISDIMSFPVTTVPPETSMREVHSLMAEQKIRGVLVVEDGALLGIIVLWDFKKVKQEKQWDSPVKAFMARDITTIAPDALPSKAAQIMVENNIGHLPVVHDDAVIGIVTRSDILTYYYDLLPE